MPVKRFNKIFDDLKILFGQDEEAMGMIEKLESKLKNIKHSHLDFFVTKQMDPGSIEQKFPLPFSSVEVGSFFLFSDGACRGNPGPGSWAAIGQNAKAEVIFESSGIDVYTTNNRMELQAAIMALQDLLGHLKEGGEYTLDQAKVFLYSDSKYVIDGISKWVPGWKARGWKKADNKAPENIQLWKEFDELAETFTHLKFHWVRGHMGHPQNEFVDNLANHALDDAGY